MSHPVRVSQGGRILLPATIRKALHLNEGSTLMIEAKGNVIQLTPTAEKVRQAQELLAPYRKPGRSYVDEFLEERRKEAARE